MEHRHLDHHTVGGRESHTVADTLAVVYYVIVSEHYALGEAGRARGILHIAYVTGAYCRRHSCHLLGADELVSLHRLVEGKRARLLKADGDYVSEEGKTLCTQRLAGDSVLYLGAEGVDDLAVV